MNQEIRGLAAATRKVFPDLEELSRAAGAAFAEAVRRSSRFAVALSGGTTPLRLYALLAAEDIDWGKVDIFLADERFVPVDHLDSNERAIRATLLDRIEIPPENFHRVYDPSGPEQSARAYDKLLRERFRNGPTFDCAILGVGEDGHTASIFPGVPQPKGVLAYSTVGPKPPPQRITVSELCLGRSRQAWFIVSGKAKRKALQRCFAGEDLPASKVAGRAEHVTWWLDAAAASSQSSSIS